MILHGVSYSAYTLRYGSYCAYRIAPSRQSFLTFYGVLPDVYLESHCVSPNVMLLIQYALYIIFSQDS